MEKDINIPMIIQTTLLMKNTSLKTSEEEYTITRPIKDLKERSRKGWNIGERKETKKR